MRALRQPPNNSNIAIRPPPRLVVHREPVKPVDGVPRVLVLTFATFRGGPVAWNSLLRHVVKPNHADIACISTAEQCDAQQALFRFTYSFTHYYYHDWGLYIEDSITKSKQWRHALCRPEAHQRPGMDEWSQFDMLGGIKNCAVHSGSGGIMLMYRNMAIEMLEAGQLLAKYDFFVWTRVDYLFLCPPPQPVNLDPAKVYIPRGEGWGGYTDRFAIIPTHLAPLYFNVTKDVILNWRYWESLLSNKSFKGNLESTLHNYFVREGVPVAFFVHTGAVVKRKQDTTGWQSSSRYWVSDHPVLKKYGLTLKYPDELKEAEEACSDHPWEAFRKWATKVHA